MNEVITATSAGVIPAGPFSPVLVYSALGRAERQPWRAARSNRARPVDQDLETAVDGVFVGLFDELAVVGCGVGARLARTWLGAVAPYRRCGPDRTAGDHPGVEFRAACGGAPRARISFPQQSACPRTRWLRLHNGAKCSVTTAALRWGSEGTGRSRMPCTGPRRHLRRGPLASSIRQRILGRGHTTRPGSSRDQIVHFVEDRLMCLPRRWGEVG